MIVDERGTGVKSRDPEELIDALVQEEWTDEEYESLVDRLQTIQEEGRPLGYYICKINEAPSIETLKQELLQNEAQFDDEGHIQKEGYQVRHTSETELEATRWRIDVEKDFNFRTGEIETSEDVKPVDFEVNLDDMRVLIDTNQYGKAKSVQSKLEKSGFDFEGVGHRNLNSEDANEQVERFVEALEDKLE
ncbi:hypothetical protein [Haloarcula brevis]|uniref:hypothetical protein n=1 Tax=Haloarcula brevis TaxID=3111453 RepID=UPI00300F3F18